MTLASWVELIKAALEFPQVIMEFIRMVKDTPSEKHEDLLKKIQKEREQLKKGGRPSW